MFSLTIRFPGTFVQPRTHPRHQSTRTKPYIAIPSAKRCVNSASASWLKPKHSSESQTHFFAPEADAPLHFCNNSSNHFLTNLSIHNNVRCDGPRSCPRKLSSAAAACSARAAAADFAPELSELLFFGLKLHSGLLLRAAGLLALLLFPGAPTAPHRAI